MERTAGAANGETAAEQEMEKSGEVGEVESRSSKWEPTQMEHSRMWCTCSANILDRKYGSKVSENSYGSRRSRCQRLLGFLLCSYLMSYAHDGYFMITNNYSLQL